MVERSTFGKGEGDVPQGGIICAQCKLVCCGEITIELNGKTFCGWDCKLKSEGYDVELGFVEKLYADAIKNTKQGG